MLLLSDDSLKDLLSQKSLTKLEKVLICLAATPSDPKAVKEIRILAVANGLRAAQKWNISSILQRATEYAVRGESGWELTTEGKKTVRTVTSPLISSPIPAVASSLRSHLVDIKGKDARTFVEEAISCFESRNYRAAVVLSWVGAVSVLYDHVVESHLTSFNAEASRRTANSKYKWQTAKNSDDLSRMKESEFLIVLEKLSIIAKSTKKQLENCLDLRNGCGHPNSLKLADHVVSSHVELLMLNVYSKF